jgi:hypothetical protein
MGYLREADQLLSIFWVGYKQWEPKKFYRNYDVNFDVYSGFNFGGDWIAKGIEGGFSMNFKNYWNGFTGGNLSLPSLSSGMLRGGPMMKVTGQYNYRLGFNTDDRKKVVFNVFSSVNGGFQHSSFSLYGELGVTLKPTNYLRISLSPGYNNSKDELQYVATESYGTSERYIFGNIDMSTISASIRVNLNLSPDLTLQYWGQPFVAAGSYTKYKYITDPLADKYTDRFRLYTDGQITAGDGIYSIDENIDGTADYQFDRPDFNVQEFLSNLVLRWEYNPGSSIYLVWSQNRSGFNDSGNMDLGTDLGNLFNGEINHPYNVFLIKFSYRFGLR